MNHSRFIEFGVLVLLPLLIYAHSLGNVFVAFDDELLIIDNPTARGLSAENVKAAFMTYDPELYVPLTLLTYQIEYSLFELNPTGYHVTSLLIHILGGLLLFAIFVQFFRRDLSLILALLFVLHPMNTEAVAWASGRKDLLSSMFFLLSVWQYLRFSKNGKGYIMSIVTFTLGLMSKVSIVPLPLILILIDWYQGRSFDRSAFKEKLPYFIIAIAFIVIALFGKSQVSDMKTWILLGFIGIPFHVFKYVIPWGLSIFYPYTGEVSFLAPQILMGFTVTILFAIFAVLTLRKTKHFAFAALWYVMLIGPSLLNSIKGGEDGALFLYFASDRYIYLAGIGVLFLFGTFLTDLRERFNPKIFKGALATLIVIFAVLTYRQSMVWRDSESLFAHAVAQGTSGYAAYLNLAGIEAERGNYDRAIDLYLDSLNVHPSSKAYLNLGQIYALQERNEEAIAAYEKALEIWPNTPQVHLNIGTLHMKEGNAEKALPYLERAVEINPNLVSAHFNLGILYEYFSRSEEAQGAFKRVLELKPDDEQAKRKLREGFQ